MQELRLERQAREVEQLRRRLMFELLVLERLRRRGHADGAPPARPGLLSIHEVRRVPKHGPPGVCCRIARKACPLRPATGNAALRRGIPPPRWTR